MYQPHTHQTGISRWAQMSSDVLIRWNKQILDTNLDLSLLYNHFFYSEVPLSVCGRFCSRSDVGLSEGFRSSLSLSNVLFLSVWLFLSLSEQLGHHICPGLGLACSRCTSCWTCVEIGRKCLPFQRDYFSSYWQLLRVWGNCKCCWETDLFHNTVIELCKK